MLYFISFQTDKKNASTSLKHFNLVFLRRWRRERASLWFLQLKYLDWDAWISFAGSTSLHLLNRMWHKSKPFSSKTFFILFANASATLLLTTSTGPRNSSFNSVVSNQRIWQYRQFDMVTFFCHVIRQEIKTSSCNKSVFECTFQMISYA